MIPTGRQIREGRLLTGMSQTALALVAEIGLEMLIRAELVDGMPMITRKDSAAIQRALETAGVEFIAETGEGPGVRLRKVTQ